MSLDSLQNLCFYVLMRDDGKFVFSQDTWTQDIIEARKYFKIGPARSMMTYTFKRTGQAPKLVKASIGNIEVIDETDRVNKRKLLNKKAKASKEKAYKKYELEIALKRFEEAKKRLDSLEKDKS